ncbi:hypothetical protein HYH03_000683 [Edaphochlamys debaryana]|uniref:Alpha-ketoglutarate-dependent dioxygenase AlkB-like domain-containing protein n=1 Tax=Edaphochlamys debaryana TaxID=47281 RepID=A0A836C6F1_9CHLO|nr:hypothetical protein HYH03_000683 [Edaphochlamys debaryana]|eukprot:KAG2502196.1 hypothetical protein HYH03_000683 [Edaphochlamys debaryana]
MAYSDAEEPPGDDDAGTARTAFRDAEKRYQLHRERRMKVDKNGKQRAGRWVVRPTDLSDVLDLTRTPAAEGLVRHEVPGVPGPVYTLERHPGLIVLPGALCPEQQSRLLAAALTDFCQPPARTNHHLQYGPLPGLWQAAEQGLRLNWRRKDDPQANPGAPRRVGCELTPAQAPLVPHAAKQAPAAGVQRAPDSDGACAATACTNGCTAAGDQAPEPAQENGSGSRPDHPGTCGTRPAAAEGEATAPGGSGPGRPTRHGSEAGAGDQTHHGRYGGGDGDGGSSSGGGRSRRSSCSSADIAASLEPGAAEGEGPAAPSLEACWSGCGSGPPARQLVRKLRWATLGPQFLWSQRRYDFASNFRPLPPSLAELASQLAAAVRSLRGVGLAAGPAGGFSREYCPDAAIVNYYQQGDVLGGHLDDVEVDLAQPIVSVSLGCPAVFLMGGLSKALPPSALLLRGGDVLVLAGEARRCFHGVPRILEPSQLPEAGAAGGEGAGRRGRSKGPVQQGDGADEAWGGVEGYAQSARINISRMAPPPPGPHPAADLLQEARAARQRLQDMSSVAQGTPAVRQLLQAARTSCQMAREGLALVLGAGSAGVMEAALPIVGEWAGKAQATSQSAAGRAQAVAQAYSSLLASYAPAAPSAPLTALAAQAERLAASAAEEERTAADALEAARRAITAQRNAENAMAVDPAVPRQGADPPAGGAAAPAPAPADVRGQRAGGPGAGGPVAGGPSTSAPNRHCGSRQDLHTASRTERLPERRARTPDRDRGRSRSRSRSPGWQRAGQQEDDRAA